MHSLVWSHQCGDSCTYIMSHSRRHLFLPFIHSLIIFLLTSMVPAIPYSSPSLELSSDEISSCLPQLSTAVFTDPRHLLSAVGTDLESRAKESNIVYAHAYKLACQLRSGAASSIAPGQFWITCHSRQGRTTALELVLSCTEGSLGTYPIFIYSHRPVPKSSSRMFLSHLHACISAVIKTLSGVTPPQRVFSVFSLAPITQIFAEKWTALFGGLYPTVETPWYAATSSYCTADTFRGLSPSSRSGADGRTMNPPGHVMRKATLNDLDQCAALCEAFAKTGPPYELSSSQAIKEAEGMIRANQLWVYELPSDSQNCSNMESVSTRTAIATIVAVTRSTPTVSAITKVYTDTAYRSRGCAERLVAHVTNELLTGSSHGRPVDARTQVTSKQHAVTLFVGHTLDATRVYRRVGFVGLDGSKQDGVEDWLELGFNGATLGHW